MPLRENLQFRAGDFTGTSSQPTLLSVVREVPQVKRNKLWVCDSMISANKEFKAQSRREITAVSSIFTVQSTEHCYLTSARLNGTQGTA